jgi:DNA-binding LytR/AlgR family response regulator
MLKVPGIRKPLLTELIVWVQGEESYAWVHMANKQCHLITLTLKWFEDQLSEFIRVHKSALINPTHITEFDQSTSIKAQVLLSSGIKLKVSRRRIRVVVERLRVGI